MREGKTLSVCPVCLKRIPAERVSRGSDVYLRKSCPEHGEFETVIWRGDDAAFDKWWDYSPKSRALVSDCPNACGLCKSHLNKTCCALVEVTSRCNLHCPVCFADAKRGDTGDVPVSQLYEMFKKLVKNGNTFVQLSGGEPTVRDDLPEIIAAARRAGMQTVQLNSNGLRFAREPSYAKSLADVGLSFVFLQFDGISDKVYETLRGESLLIDKLRAINACGKSGLGITLVPTVVPGVNDNEIGPIIDLAVSCSPAVRGVHFQPVSYFGRYPEPPRDDDRITLPEILTEIEAQTNRFAIRDFIPSSCDHPRCGFHGDFVVLPHGRIMKLTKKYDPETDCCGDASDDAYLKNRAFVARRWTRDGKAERENTAIENEDAPDMSAFLSRVKSHGFTISAMAFQDAWTLELERLRKCSLHVFADGETVPFCARYVTAGG